MISITILLIIVSAVAWVLHLVQPSTKFKRLGALIPGPKPYPLLGNIPNAGVDSKRINSVLNGIADKYGRTFRMFLGQDLMIFLSDPEDVEFILSKSKQLTKSRNSMIAGKPWIGEGLLIGPEDKWKINRRRLLPAFHLKIIENFVPVFHKNSEKLIEELSAFVDKGEVDITEASAKFALRNICETAMGISLDSISDDDFYSKAVSELNAIFATKIFVPLFKNKLFYNLHPLGRREKRLLHYIDSITEKVIRSRRAECRKWDVEDGNDEHLAEGQRRRLIFLDLMLHIQKEDSSFTDQQIRDEVNTLMFAGHDTVSATTSFCLHLLSKHPEVQEKIYEEINAILGGSDRPPSLKDLQEMKYLEQVIKETLRMYSSVPMIGRCANADLQLKNGLIIPQNADIVLWLHRMHNDSQLYPNPSVFNPDNFSPENVQKRHPYSFLPFGGGSRDCIGMKYAYNELKVGLSNLARNFIFLPSETQTELYLITEIVLKTDSGIHVKIKRR